jgi:AcrR family transcriptional regulator
MALMSDKTALRTQQIAAMAEHVLNHGLQSASLRPLAKAAGTSDRMLIYHFGSRDQIIDAVLLHLAAQVKEGLNQALPAEPMPTREACIQIIMDILRTDHFRRFNSIWFEILAGASAGLPSFQSTARQIMKDFAEGPELRVPSSESDRPAAAWALLSVIEGLVVMDAAGHLLAMEKVTTEVLAT